MCGWLRDKWGVPWQIVPEMLPRLLADPDPNVSARVFAAMTKMVKLDVAAARACGRRMRRAHLTTSRPRHANWADYPCHSRVRGNQTAESRQLPLDSRFRGNDNGVRTDRHYLLIETRQTRSPPCPTPFSNICAELSRKSKPTA